MARKKGSEKTRERKGSLEKTCGRTTTNVVKFPQFRKHSNTVYFCSYSYHRGIIKDPTQCQARECTHYREIPVEDLINNEDYKVF